jgi:hypothetical protein
MALTTHVFHVHAAVARRAKLLAVFTLAFILSAYIGPLVASGYVI